MNFSSQEINADCKFIVEFTFSHTKTTGISIKANSNVMAGNPNLPTPLGSNLSRYEPIYKIWIFPEYNNQSLIKYRIIMSSNH